MDFLKILRSFEDFVFEAASWLIFFPLTLYRIVRRPLATMAYSDREQSESTEHRYDDALSPPLVLLFTIFLANALGSALHVPPPETSSVMIASLYASQQNLILFRSLSFSLIPLIAAATLLKLQDRRLNRESLRGPFYAQCYLAAPLAALFSVGSILHQRSGSAAAIDLTLMAAGFVWLLIVQTRWFHAKLAVSWARAAATAVWAVVRALLVIFAIMIPILLI